MLFGDTDADGDGFLNGSEAQGIADMNSNATGDEMAVDDLIAAYDEDEDGTLSEEETLNALEDNRPEGPPPPPEESTRGSTSGSWAQTGGLENYMMMANLGADQDRSSAISELFGSGAFSSSSTRFTVNTMV